MPQAAASDHAIGRQRDPHAHYRYGNWHIVNALKPAGFNRGSRHGLFAADHRCFTLVGPIILPAVQHEGRGIARLTI
jgi:hypothetical protein